MPDRWIALCRRLAPSALRATAFDPAIADLSADEASRTSSRSRARRLAGRASLLLRILTTALECRRLAATSGRRVHQETGRQQGNLMIWLRDIREAVRVLIRQPWFSLAAILVLALGIGVNLTVFSFVNSLLLAPISAPDPDRLVRVHGTSGDNLTDTVSYPNYLDAEARTRSVDLAAHVQAIARVGAGDTAETRAVELVTGNYFRVLGLSPSAGRLLEDRDDVSEGAHAVVVVSRQFWRTRFGGDPAALGRSLEINGTPFQIVGIAPDGFRGTFSGHAVDVWAPLSMQQQVRPRGQTRQNRNWGWLRMIGRLQGNATLNQAHAELAEAAADINRRFPSSPPPLGFAAVPASALADADRESVRPFLALVFGFTVLLFVVTCANLAGVMQARLLSRTRELAIRQSLGASRGRLAVAWLTEAFVLSLAGAMAGVLLSRVMATLIAQVSLPTQLLGDATFDTSLDWRVWTYALGTAIVASVLFGLSPAFRAGRTAPLEVLKDEGSTVSGGRRGLRLRRAAVFVQVAVSVALVATAGLLAAGLARAQRLDPGYPTSSVGLMSFSLQRQSIPAAARPEATSRLLERIRTEPGVVSAELAMSVPLGLGSDRMRFRVPGFVTPDGTGNLSIEFNVVGSRYFATLGTPFVAGRAWDPGALAPDAPPVVINEAMARRYWKDGQAVGQPVEIVGRGMARVSGIVRDSAYRAVGETPFPIIYLPAEAEPPGSFAVLVRTTGDPATILARLERGLPALDPRFAPFDVMTFDALRGVPLFPARMLLVAAGMFGALALLLTGIGLYGVVSMSVAQRTREIGLRMALGARPGVVVRGIAREVATVVALGATAGAVGAAYLGRGLETWLAGLPAFHPVVAALTALILLMLALAAAWIPARRAARVDPVGALRG